VFLRSAAVLRCERAPDPLAHSSNAKAAVAEVAMVAEAMVVRGGDGHGGTI
jgi:hypothetical protein